ncbi:unnamed protein product [Moneuplotes crassus]|uniref:BRCA2 OB1 domain-containing protein n=1 Tax=Euplotes crassus TaxID=5936 RepID=A0AAD1Y708_EUPCR|nr:unnamed protein product [Moneuplotes crassus]
MSLEERDQIVKEVVDQLVGQVAQESQDILRKEVVKIKPQDDNETAENNLEHSYNSQQERNESSKLIASPGNDDSLLPCSKTFCRDGDRRSMPLKMINEENAKKSLSYKENDVSHSQISFDKSGKPIEEYLSNLSEEDISQYASPVKKAICSNDDSNSTRKEEIKQTQKQEESSNTSGSNLVYGGGKYISYGANKVGVCINNDTMNYFEHQKAPQNHGYPPGMKTNFPMGNYQRGYNGQNTNMYNPGVGRMNPHQNYQMYNQQYQNRKPPVINTKQQDSRIEHYRSMIDDLKEENRRLKEAREEISKHKDFYYKNIISSLNNINDRKETLIKHQSEMIETLRKGMSFSCPPVRESRNDFTNFNTPAEDVGFCNTSFNFSNMNNTIEKADESPGFSMPSFDARNKVNQARSMSESQGFSHPPNVEDIKIPASIDESKPSETPMFDKPDKTSSALKGFDLFKSAGKKISSKFKLGGNGNTNKLQSTKRLHKFMKDLNQELDDDKKLLEGFNIPTEDKDGELQFGSPPPLQTSTEPAESTEVQTKEQKTNVKQNEEKDVEMTAENEEVKAESEESLTKDEKITEMKLPQTHSLGAPQLIENKTSENDSIMEVDCPSEMPFSIEDSSKQDLCIIEDSPLKDFEKEKQNMKEYTIENTLLRLINLEENQREANIFPMLVRNKGKDSPMGKYKFLTKKITGALLEFKDIKIDCLCIRDEKYSTTNIICSLCQNSGALNSEQIHKILGILLKKKYDKQDLSKEFCEKWTHHHFRFALWKLKSFERASNEELELYNLENIISDLLKKYDWEFEQGNRSFFQKIIESDESPARKVVLLIANIEEIEEGKCLLELYDGRYCLFSVIKENDTSYLEDSPQIYQLIKEKKLYAGLKIHVASSALTSDGIDDVIVQKEDINCPHYYLSKQCSNSLILNYNSISRARIDEKLGFQKDKFLTKWLKDVNQLCRTVSRINVYITKIYPLYLVHTVSDTRKVLRSFDTFQEINEELGKKMTEELKTLKSRGATEEEIRERQEELQGSNQDKFMLFFKIKVVDAMYNEEKVSLNKRETIITVMDTTIDMYDSLEIGDRVIFYNLLTDTFKKSGEFKNKYIESKQLCLSFKCKKSRYDILRHYDMTSKAERQIGLDRIEPLVNMEKLFAIFTDIFKKTKKMEAQERTKAILSEFKLQEVSFVGLILRISSSNTEFSFGLKCIRKVYVLLPNHHLVILNICDPNFYTEKSFPSENTVAIFESVYFEQLVELNLSDQNVNFVEILKSEKWMNSKALYQDDSAFVLSFNSSCQTKVIKEKAVFAKYLTDEFYKKEIETLQKMIDNEDHIILKRCKEVGIITQSSPPIFDRSKAKKQTKTHNLHKGLTAINENASDQGNPHPKISPYITHLEIPPQKFNIKFTSKSKPAKPKSKKFPNKIQKSTKFKPKTKKRQKIHEEKEVEIQIDLNKDLKKSESQADNDSSVEIQEHLCVTPKRGKLGTEVGKCMTVDEKSCRGEIEWSSQGKEEGETVQSAPYEKMRRVVKKIPVKRKDRGKQNLEIEEETINTAKATIDNESVPTRISGSNCMEGTTRSSTIFSNNKIDQEDEESIDFDIRVESETPQEDAIQSEEALEENKEENKKSKKSKKTKKKLRKRARKEVQKSGSDSSEAEYLPDKGSSFRKRSRNTSISHHSKGQNQVNFPNSQENPVEIEDIEEISDPVEAIDIQEETPIEVEEEIIDDE